MILYRILLLLLTPVIFIHLLWRALHCGEWRYFAHRVGLEFDDVPEHSIWIHCASVGEVKSVLPLLEKLHAARPDQHFLITSNTATSRHIVMQYDAEWISHLYCPIDWRLATRSFLKHARPSRCYLFETELWPNLMMSCAARGIEIDIINGRISDNTMKRAGLLKHVYARPLSSVHSIHTRNEEDRNRYIELGADNDIVSVTGDLKLARPQNSKMPPQQRTTRPYILVVSTHEDEESRIVEQCRALLDDYLLVIAPRHPERCNSVANALHNQGFKIAMHSSHDEITGETDIYMIDTIGLLDAWFPGAYCVVMGGTFVDIGGHNLIEPLAHGCACVYGPSMHNFTEMNDIVIANNAAIQIQDIEELNGVLSDWLRDEAKLAELKRRALELTASLNSTIDDYATLIRDQLER